MNDDVTTITLTVDQFIRVLVDDNLRQRILYAIHRATLNNWDGPYEDVSST